MKYVMIFLFFLLIPSFIVMYNVKFRRSILLPIIGAIIATVWIVYLLGDIFEQEAKRNETKIEIIQDDFKYLSPTLTSKDLHTVQCKIDSLQKNYAIYKLTNSKIAAIKNDTIITTNSTLQFKNEQDYNKCKDSLINLKNKLVFFKEVSIKQNDNILTKKFLTYTFIVIIAIIIIVVLILLISNYFNFTNNKKASIKDLFENPKDKSIQLNIEQQKKIDLYDWYLNVYLNNDVIKDKNYLYNIETAENIKPIFDISNELDDEKRSKFLTSLNLTFKKIHDNFNSDTHSNSKEFHLLSKFFYDNKDYKERLSSECNKLSQQAKLNIIICFLIAIFMFLLLGFIILAPIFNENPLKITNFVEFLINFLPRLVSILGLGTVFLYFINLYKTNLHDVKYFQNELTNIEMKELALKITLYTNNKVADEVLKELLLTERNKILKTGETTPELERLKVEKDVNKDFLEKLWSLLEIKHLNDNTKSKSEPKQEQTNG